MDEYATYEYTLLDPGHIRLLKLEPLLPDAATLKGSIITKPLMNPTFQPSSKDGTPAGLLHSFAYEAVSYHWGCDQTPVSHLLITVGEQIKQLKLSGSMDALLRQFALHDRTRTLWVDSICINQTDKKEKAQQQLPLMPQIYQTAERVLIYLGPEDDSRLAIDMIMHVAKFSEYLDGSQNLPGRSGLRLAADKGFTLPSANDQRWPAWRAFWRRGWFRRAWIIQEFVYATEIKMLCGDVELDWYMLKKATDAYIENNHLIYTGFNPLRGTRHMEDFREAHEGAIAFFRVANFRMKAWGGMTAAYLMLSLTDKSGAREELTLLGIREKLTPATDYNFWRMFEGYARAKILESRAKGEVFPHGQWDLLYLLQCTRNCRATEPVDRMYALLGLAEEGNHPDFKPNYDESLCETSQRYAAALVRRGRCQEVLSMIGMTRASQPTKLPHILLIDFVQSIPESLRRVWMMFTTLGRETHPGRDGLLRDLPSWVPDWTSVIYAQSITVGFCYSVAGFESSSEFRAVLKGESGGSRNYLDTVDGESDEEGRRPLYNAALNSAPDVNIFKETGTLELTGRRFDSIDGILPGRLLLSPLWYEIIVDSFISPYPTGEPVEEVIWRTLIANRTYDMMRAPAEFAAEYAYLKTLDTGVPTRGVLVVNMAGSIALYALIMAFGWDFWVQGCLCSASGALGLGYSLPFKLLALKSLAEFLPWWAIISSCGPWSTDG